MERETAGTVFDIQHFSLGDGPGIRTTVFLKGCPLNCEWCHNPESLMGRPQVMFYQERCVSCAACATVCPNGCHRLDAATHSFDSGKCTGCGKCAAACRYDALETVGRSMTVSQVLDEVEEDAVFYESSQGGMTLSGGEPLYQSNFTIALAKGAKERNIHVCVETSGYGRTESLIELAKYTDMFLYDYKATGEDHEKFTGRDDQLILKNLLAIDSCGAKILLRCPIIPERNTNEAHIVGIIRIAKQLTNLVGIDLEPYHNMGLRKREQLGACQSYQIIKPPTKEYMQCIGNKIAEALSIPVRQM